MGSIQQLNSSLINKIAAGEVVERPLSVVKELTENAIDAGASAVTVEVQDGGLTMIRVTDNGGGIPADELPLAFARHATSKIASADDLYHITTLGFRGEALASIAEVSQTEMISKTAWATLGARIEIHGGIETARQETACADGTTVIVSNLFYNTPARRKFLKRPSVEAGYVADICQRLALANPELTFRYIQDGRPVFSTNGSGLKAAAHAVFGRETAAKMLPLSVADASRRLSGFLGKPEVARGNRQYGLFFLNGRYIQNRMLARAVEDALHTALPSGRFPVYVLQLTVNPADVDVNVHPAKTEVRFENDASIFSFVQDAVRETFRDQNLIPEVRLGRKERGVSEERAYAEQSLAEFTAPQPFFPSQNTAASLGHSGRAAVSSAGGDAPVSAVPVSSGTGLTLREVYVPPPEPIPEPPAAGRFQDYRVLGLLFGTYWLVAQSDSLFMIDQHAAHERVLYEDTLASMDSGTVGAQTLLEPLRLRLTPREMQTLTDHRALFDRCGFQFRIENETQTAVTAVPFIFRNPVSASFFTDLLDRLDLAVHAAGSLHRNKLGIVATLACKAAVKANDGLTETEARALLERLLSMENPFSCPHGRPTVIKITRRELERKFGRIQ